MTQPLEYASPAERMSGRLSPWGKGFLAVAGTLLFPGFGHLLTGSVRRAGAWLGGALLLTAAYIAVLVTPALLPALFVLVPLLLVFSLACMVDAFVCGRRSKLPMLFTPGLRYLAGLVLIAVAVIGQPVTRLLRLALRGWVEGYIFPVASMSPTLMPDDRFLVLKTGRAVRRWDVIALHPTAARWADDVYIERVAGLPGEKIEIVDGKVQVNGQPVSPPEPIGPYVVAGPLHSYDLNGCEGNPIFLKEGEYFVLGDNSPISADSRMWSEGAPGHQPGALPADHIVGRVTAIYWPPNRWRRFP